MFLGWDADARIRDGEVKRLVARGDLDPLRRGVHFDPDRDLPFGGEFDGVADQVDEDLPQACGVPFESIGHVGQDAEDQFQPLLVGARASMSIASPNTSRI